MECNDLLRSHSDSRICPQERLGRIIGKASFDFSESLGSVRMLALLNTFREEPVTGFMFYELDERTRVDWLKSQLRESGFSDEF
jgi:hypothetical protein